MDDADSSLARSLEPLHDSVARTDAGLGESCVMKAQNPLYIAGRGKGRCPSRTHPQKQNLIVYTEELTHLESHRSPKGNRQMRRILNQAANAAAKSKGTIFEIVYRRLGSRLGHNQTIGGHRPSALSPDLDHSASRSTLRRARSLGKRKVETTAHSIG